MIKTANRAKEQATTLLRGLSGNVNLTAAKLERYMSSRKLSA